MMMIEYYYTRLSLLGIFALLCSTLGDEVLEQLRVVQRSINGNVSSFCYHGPSGTKNAFLAQSYRAHTKDLNVLVYPFCLETRELGNRLGNYFHEVTCAEASGLHFVAIHPQWDITNSINGNHTASNSNRLAFLQALPDIVAHPHPLSRAEAAKEIQKECKCNRYCWQHRDAPWVSRTHTIRDYLQRAVKAYLLSLPEGSHTMIDPEHDLTNIAVSEQANLPIVPDVAIQYRCGDNLGFSYRYGILPFTALASRIPKDSQWIFVLSDHPSRSPHNPGTQRCGPILRKLLDYLQSNFPTAKIVIKRGGDLFLDVVRLAQARTAICSASSFCFWPALSNPHAAYFPVTSLIAGADTVDLAPNLGPTFHWMNESYLSNFKGLRPWTQVFDVLTGKMPIP
eukprot:scaffold26_cov159-Ochromonas_danica.AAC.8